jgi:hypothetical protein
MSNSVAVAIFVSYLCGKYEDAGITGNFCKLSIGEIEVCLGSKLLMNIGFEAENSIYVNSKFHTTQPDKAKKYIQIIIENAIQPGVNNANRQSVRV